MLIEERRRFDLEWTGGDGSMIWQLADKRRPRLNER